MKYIASVYSLNAKTESQEDRDMREGRYSYTMEAVSKMAMKGEFVFSPIVHCHPMATHFEMPKGYQFYQANDRHFIEISDSVIVLKMPGWEDSEGITDEIAYAKELGKDITYVECPDYTEEV